MKVKLLEKQAIELAKVPEIIKSSGELNPDQQKVHDIAKKFARLTPANAEKLRKEIEALNVVRLTENHIVQILDLLPAEATDLHTILAGSKTTITAENLEKITQIVKTYVK